jgi:hypothetical protein
MLRAPADTGDISTIILEAYTSNPFKIADESKNNKLKYNGW